jgi:hypothetical protein
MRHPEISSHSIAFIGFVFLSSIWIASVIGGASLAEQVGVKPRNTRMVAPAPIIPAGVLPGHEWNLSFSEEFEGTDYNHSKLTPCFDWNVGACTSSFNKGREHYLASQIVVSGGTAKLIAAPLSPSFPTPDGACVGNFCTYKSGMLATSRPIDALNTDYLFRFTYGYVETRIKFPAVQGFFTAFWMLPADGKFTYDKEIDMAEILGNDPTWIHMTYLYNKRAVLVHPAGAVDNMGACPKIDYSTGWVTLGMDWQPTHVAWYINGVKCGQYEDLSGVTIQQGPMQLILNMMVGNSWQRSWGVDLLNATLQEQLEVDYIRVWQ